MLRLKGTTEAVRVARDPGAVAGGQQVATLTIIRLAQGGTRVKKATCWWSSTGKHKCGTSSTSKPSMRSWSTRSPQEQAKENAARAKDETELKTAEDSLRKAELEIQKSEIASRIDAEKNQENLDEAKATFDQLRETFDLKRKAAKAAIRILEIQRDRTKQTMEHAQANADLMQIHSPLDGVVVLNTIWKQGHDGRSARGRSSASGSSFYAGRGSFGDAGTCAGKSAGLPSPPGGTESECANGRLSRILSFQRKVEQVAPVGEHGSFSEKVRVFAVVVSIEGNDPKLMPDLSAAVDVDVADQDAATRQASIAKGGSQ